MLHMTYHISLSLRLSLFSWSVDGLPWVGPWSPHASQISDNPHPVDDSPKPISSERAINRESSFFKGKVPHSSSSAYLLTGVNGTSAHVHEQEEETERVCDHFLCVGFSGHGLTQTLLSGKAVAAMVASLSPDCFAFTPLLIQEDF